MNSKLPFLTILLVAVSFSMLPGQELLSAAGGKASTDQIMLTWSTGEIVTATIVGEDFHLTQGFLQPQLQVTSIVTSQNELDVRIYPNPTVHKLYIRAPNNIKVNVYSSMGKKILEKELSNQNIISTSSWPPGYYVLEVLEPLKTNRAFFQIIKI